MRKRVICLVLVWAVLLLLPAALPSQAASRPTNTTPPAPAGSDNNNDAKSIKDSITFKHKGCGPNGSECRVAYALELDDGAMFKIHIDSTILAEFTYDVAGVLLADASRPNLNAVEYGTKILTQKHEKKYGGYLVSIRRKGATSSLPEATLVISVRTRQWTLAFGGGFPVSTITDKVFGLRDSTIQTAGTGGAPATTATKYLVDREKGQEDKVSLATAAFIHLSHTAHPNWGVTFGLGVGGNTTYYLGPSWLFGDVGALTLGAAFGSRKELPAGVHVNELTTNANAIATLPSRNTVGGFVAFSFSFLGNSSAFEKPFKGNESPPTSGNTTESRTTSSAPAASDNKLAVAPKTLKPGGDATFTISIGPAPNGRKFQSGNFDLKEPNGPFTLTGTTVQLDPVPSDSTHAQGTFKAKLNATASGSVHLEIRVVGQGFDAKVTSGDVSVSPQP